MTLTRWHRGHGVLGWKRVGDAVGRRHRQDRARVGHRHPRPRRAEGPRGPTKKEGDGKSPAGAFTCAALRLRRRRSTSAAAVRAPTDDHECVDDPSPQPTTQIVERNGLAPTGSRPSTCAATTTCTRSALVVAHNPSARPGDGSCIFLHVWGGPDSTTVGCTAMDKDKLEALLDLLTRRAGVRAAARAPNTARSSMNGACLRSRLPP